MKRNLKIFLLIVVISSGFFLLINYPNERYKIASSLLLNPLNPGNPVIIDVKNNVNNDNHNKKIPKIFCIILTQEKNLIKRAKVVYDTWAHKCDNYKFITAMSANNELVTNTVSPSSSLSNSLTMNESIEYTINNTFTVLHPAGLINDTYRKLSQKVFLAYKDIYKRYKGYDWYLKADDDTFVIFENLRKFVKERNASLPVTYGYDFNVIVEKGYHSGGGGYLMSQKAFNRIGSKLNKDFDFCKMTGTEDVDVARCLRRLKVFPRKSTDRLGRERFHCLPIRYSYYGYYPKWLKKYAANKLKKGLSCCSDTSISFHYIQPIEMIRLESVIQEQAKIGKKSFKYIIKKLYNLKESQLKYN